MLKPPEIDRAGIADSEMRMLYGICSQIEKKVGKSEGKLDRKKNYRNFFGAVILAYCDCVVPLETNNHDMSKGQVCYRWYSVGIGEGKAASPSCFLSL